jgi:hypothetical protein
VTYRLSMNIDNNLHLEIEEPVFKDLISLFQRMGGDEKWLVNAARAAVARSLHGEAIGNLTRAGVHGTVIDEEEIPPSRNSSSGRKADTADPWSSDRNDYPGEASVARGALTGSGPADGDPWGQGTQDEPHERQRPAAGREQSRESGARRTKTTTDKFGREFTMGLPEAPDCDCGIAAARMKAKGRDSGKWYSKWVCSKAVGSDYRDKCDFSEFM